MGICRDPHSQGFTLIEIMVVVVIIAILAGMLVPQLAGTADTVRLDAAARRIGDMMDYCYHAAATSGRTHALLFDTVQRRIDVVAEAPPAAEGETADATGAPVGEGATPAPTPAPTPTPAPAPAPEAAPADPSAPPPTDATGAPAVEGPAPPSPLPTPFPDPTVPVTLAPVSIPGFMDRTLPVGIAIAASETYETELSAGVNEGQFKILFFPDGTTEFAKVDLITPAGQRREIWLNGMVGSVSIIDPDREGEADLASSIIDEDLLMEETMGDQGQDQGTMIEEAPPDANPPQ